jgi:hypothetical protein
MVRDYAVVLSLEFRSLECEVSGGVVRGYVLYSSIFRDVSRVREEKEIERGWVRDIYAGDFLV